MQGHGRWPQVTAHAWMVMAEGAATVCTLPGARPPRVTWRDQYPSVAKAALAVAFGKRVE